MKNLWYWIDTSKGTTSPYTAHGVHCTVQWPSKFLNIHDYEAWMKLKHVMNRDEILNYRTIRTSL